MNILFPVLTILTSIAFAGLLGYFNKIKGKNFNISPIALFFWTIAIACLMSWGFLQLFAATTRGQQSLIRFSPLFRDGLPIAYLALGMAGLIWTRRIAQRIILSLGIALLVCVGALLLVGGGGQPDVLVLPAGVRTLNGWLDFLGFLLILVGTVWSLREFLWNGGSPQKALAGVCILISGTALGILKSIQGINQASPFIAALALLSATWFAFQVTTAPANIDINRRRSRVRLYSIGFGVFSILTAVAVLPFMPVYMGISDAKFKSVYINKVPDENNGVYMVTDKGVMQLYGWSIEPDDFPSDSPTLDLTTIHSFVVVSKQFDVPEAYQLMNGTTGQQVKWQSISQQGVELVLTAASLDPGDYEFVTPTDSMFGGDTYEYFTLR